MKPPAVIETVRTILRVPRYTDANALFTQYAQDPDVSRYLTWRPHKDLRETQEFVTNCIADWKNGSQFPWVITLKDNQELVGMLGLRREGFQAEVGYAIARRFWGQGIVAETLRPVIDWTLAQPDIHRIWGRCDTDNKASARVMEKVGMKCEGLVPRSATHPNISDEPRDSYYYAIVK